MGAKYALGIDYGTLPARAMLVDVNTGVSREDVIGVCSDFTECSMLPVNKDGIPLCFQERYKSNPHSYVKLWKHHAAQDEANQLNRASVYGSLYEEYKRLHDYFGRGENTVMKTLKKIKENTYYANERGTGSDR